MRKTDIREGNVEINEEKMYRFSGSARGCCCRRPRAADVQQAAVVEPAPVEETTELGLQLADILETMSAEQTVEAGHVERLREEEQEPNTASSATATGRTPCTSSAKIYGMKMNRAKRWITVRSWRPAGSGAAYRSASAAGETAAAGLVGEATPIQYSEGGVSVTMYPTNGLDRAARTGRDSGGTAAKTGGAAGRRASPRRGGAGRHKRRRSRKNSAAAAESGADPAQAEQPSVTEAETETASMQPEAESAPESAVETAQPEMESAPETEAGGNRRTRGPGISAGQ